MTLSDCYRMLEVPGSASDEEIKKSFKLLAHKYHPDKNPHRVEWATNAMASLNEAYTTLIQARFREDKREPNAKQTAGTHTAAQYAKGATYSQGPASTEFTNGAENIRPE